MSFGNDWDSMLAAERRRDRQRVAVTSCAVKGYWAGRNFSNQHPPPPAHTGDRTEGMFYIDLRHVLLV